MNQLSILPDESPQSSEGRRVISFFVAGVAVPGGSKRAFTVKRADGSVGVRVADDAGKRNKQWREIVAFTARQHCTGPLLSGALKVSMCFVRRRPKGHFRTGRNSGQLRKAAPTYPTQAPDTTKLVRAAEDALTGVLWTNDAIIVQQISEKTFGDPPGLLVRVEQLE